MPCSCHPLLRHGLHCSFVYAVHLQAFIVSILSLMYQFFIKVIFIDFIDKKALIEPEDRTCIRNFAIAKLSSELFHLHAAGQDLCAIPHKTWMVVNKLTSFFEYSPTPHSRNEQTFV
jgi:hypothetical protein